MDYIEQIAFGRLTSGVYPKTSVSRIINFVYLQLPSWRDDPARPKKKSENQLNLSLSKYLNSIDIKENFPMVHFNREEYQTGQSSVDISASPKKEIIIGAKLYTKYNPVVIFECKRLPTPGHNREKEYVTGLSDKDGGIQRFKIGLHGEDQDAVAMIGYLQKNIPSYWFNEINKWIKDLTKDKLKDICVWDASETLKDFVESPSIGVARCLSSHNRTGIVTNSQVVIHHLWVKM
jgi:hypothetical protein